MAAIRLFITLLMVGFCAVISYEANAQSDSVEVVVPILLDKSILSGVGLEQVKLKNEPDRAFFQKELFKGEDISIYIVSSQSWKTSFDNFSFDEFVYILNGKSRVKARNGEEQTFDSYEFFTVLKGFAGTWEILVGDNYHYELSAIASERAKGINTSTSQNLTLLDKSKISGVDIQLNKDGLFEEVLSKGIELTVFLKAEKPKTINFFESKKDQLICILSGQVQIGNIQGNSQIFHTGDFFVLPKKFKGSWKSNGHGLLKSIVVERSEQVK